MENGMHPVDMVMQQLAFHDDVKVSYAPDRKLDRGEFRITLSTNRPYLPTDERNLAYKAAVLMGEKFGKSVPGGNIHIDIRKRIPVAAGMAGGSGKYHRGGFSCSSVGIDRHFSSDLAGFLRSR